jgi:hypothetical protein
MTVAGVRRLATAILNQIEDLCHAGYLGAQGLRTGRRGRGLGTTRAAVDLRPSPWLTPYLTPYGAVTPGYWRTQSLCARRRLNTGWTFERTSERAKDELENRSDRQGRSVGLPRLSLTHDTE